MKNEVTLELLAKMIDEVQQMLGQMDKRLQRIEEQVQKHEIMVSQTSNLVVQFRQEARADLQALEQRMTERIDKLQAEMNRRFDEVDGRLESLENEFIGYKLITSAHTADIEKLKMGLPPRKSIKA